MSFGHWLLISSLAVVYAGIFTAFSVHARRLRRPPLRRYCCGCGMELAPGHVCTE